jgi:hypothetical protein
MNRCCAKCLRRVSNDEGQAFAHGKVFHLACVRYDSKGIVDVHGPLATDDITVDYRGHITLWRAGLGYDWGLMSEYS